MQKQKFSDFLIDNGIEYKTDVALKNHTTFKIGGNADIFVMPETADEFILAVKGARDVGIPLFVLGKGSNILVSDSGIEGAVISTALLNDISVSGNVITCGAGATLRNVCVAARDNSLTGLEFAYGIPGSIGGAFFMNAGAYGGEIKDAAKSALCIDKNGEITEISADEMELDYRTSRFKNENLIILSVKLQLKCGEKAEISAAMEDYFSRRKEKQPLDYPSAGSTFKRPAGYFAGKLIEDSGLKGFSVGGAKVSEKHAGFVINYDNATAKDVLSLIESIKQRVKSNSGVTLNEEIIYIGRKD